MNGNPAALSAYPEDLLDDKYVLATTSLGSGEVFCCARFCFEVT
jgi:hypothetical protein